MRKRILKKIAGRTLRTTWWASIAAAIILHFIYHGVLPTESRSNSSSL